MVSFLLALVIHFSAVAAFLCQGSSKDSHLLECIFYTLKTNIIYTVNIHLYHNQYKMMVYNNDIDVIETFCRKIKY